jgi:glucosyl-3-phosphoglycerate synthase
MENTEQWFTSHTFHHRQFGDVAALVARKKRLGLQLSLCIPTLNEAATIGKVVERLLPLRDVAGLLDEIAVMDSGSADRTLELAAASGADGYRAADILPHLGHQCGKGENLWKAVYQLKGDILIFVDGDIVNMHPHFVTGLVGPLLQYPEIGYVKAFYERPGNGTDGGRVTEILVRPLLALYFPELGGVIQPLAGEYAARRTLLEQLAFPVGYGVELAHLIDISSGYGLGFLGQCDLNVREHRQRSNRELGRMAHALLQVCHRRLRQRGIVQRWVEPPNDLHQFVRREGHWQRQVHRIVEHERPPLVQVTAYRQRHGVQLGEVIGSEKSVHVAEE